MDALPNLRSSTTCSKDKVKDLQVKIIQWEDFEQELARLSSLSSALHQSQQKRLALQTHLQTLIQVQSESLSRKNQLDEISERVQLRKLVMGNMLMQAKVVEEHAQTKEDHLATEIKSLLVSGTSLSVARKRLQESGRLLAGEKGLARLSALQKILRVRQQHMISQVAYLYPVKTLIGATQELELDSFPSGSRSGTPGGNIDENKSRNQGTLTISGVQLNMLPFTQMTFFTDKKQIQGSTTALGYVAHVISLIASYLHVPLRYPLRLGGSHSYIKDCAVFNNPTSSGSNSTSLAAANKKCLEFPLFLDGQDATRAAYAIFLLNKDIEQLLNYVGIESLGPRHVLANLKELFKTILSPEFIESD
ncbi:vacuolar protein sorting 38 isoform X1 [Beta vulgaris subsp. vulgaris]|uniref:vacuolar protein sorting 38 isoform X1 n=1 Tax=Beta vulgaris subsp. vulgaris TaxID=3555 RepID=UPI0020371982|nr:vacuolar protein sorting 38 isoform X1 [Beta vulgaris subsp. vulgaris]XP_048499111.1 vacuolar protein sorting 38 isoform X1 [Beta vulgaris subsp. vulgaris]XP_048499112.1 vacuolar protein sorting 38 isoform X1 [Beta vulgaris subsp. vulgaris]XP_048499113.1 vacuolar protein sorting 38 isoform X1 [Beta vulgaris subsp. vulgaris]